MRTENFESLVYSCTSEIDTMGIDIVVGGKGETLNADRDKFKKLVKKSVESAKETNAERIVFSYRNGNLSVSADAGPAPEIRKIFVDEDQDTDREKVRNDIEFSNDSFHYRIKSAEDLLS